MSQHCKGERGSILKFLILFRGKTDQRFNIRRLHVNHRQSNPNEFLLLGEFCQFESLLVPLDGIASLTLCVQ